MTKAIRWFSSKKHTLLTVLYVIVVAISTSVTTQACWQYSNNSGYFNRNIACFSDGDCVSGQLCRSDSCWNPDGWGQICAITGTACDTGIPCSGTCHSETHACY